MPTKSLTDLTVQKLKYNKKTTTYWDTSLKGFGVRAGKRTKTFVVMTGQDRKVITSSMLFRGCVVNLWIDVKFDPKKWI